MKILKLNEMEDVYTHFEHEAGEKYVVIENVEPALHPNHTLSSLDLKENESYGLSSFMNICKDIAEDCNGYYTTTPHSGLNNYTLSFETDITDDGNTEHVLDVTFHIVLFDETFLVEDFDV